MRSLLDEDYAPLTSSIGFIDAPLAEVASALIHWRQSLHKTVTSRVDPTPFPEVLRHLEPLTTIVAPRELLLPTDSVWTAYFENAARGSDSTSTVPHLTYANGWRGAIAEAIPHTAGKATIKRGRLGSTQFQLFGERPTEFLNYVRTLAAAHDGHRWVFSAAGTPQAFEHPEQYAQRRIKDRFTPKLLDEYCRSIGIRVFDPDYYRSPGILVETHRRLPSGSVSMTLAEAQQWLEIQPSDVRRWD